MKEFLAKRADRMMPNGVREAVTNIETAALTPAGNSKTISGDVYTSATITAEGTTKADNIITTGVVVREKTGTVEQVTVSSAESQYGEHNITTYQPGTALRRRRITVVAHNVNSTTQTRHYKGSRTEKYAGHMESYSKHLLEQAQQTDKNSDR